MQIDRFPWIRKAVSRDRSEHVLIDDVLADRLTVERAQDVAGVTVEAVVRMSEQTARNILSALDGEPIRQNVINQDVL